MARLAAMAMLVVWVVLGPAAAQDFARSRLEVQTVAGGRHAFTVELAATPDQLAQGLMFRKSLPADGGMLFDFGRDQVVSMWMKNTLIPLDMLFVAADGRVVGIAERTIPHSLSTITAPAPVRAVLEVNGGTAERLGIRPGDRLIHPLFEKR